MSHPGHHTRITDSFNSAYSSINSEALETRDKKESFSVKYRRCILLLCPKEKTPEMERKYELELHKSGKWKVVMFMSTTIAIVTAIMAILIESKVIPTKKRNQNAILWRVGIYGSLITYVVNAALVYKIKDTWNFASLALMIIFTCTRVASWDVLFWLFSECDAVGQLDDGGGINTTVDLNAAFAAGFESAQGDAGMIFLPLWLLIFGPNFRNLLIVSGIALVLIAAVFAGSFKMCDSSFVAHSSVYIVWTLVGYLYVLVLSWVWEFFTRSSFHSKMAMQSDYSNLQKHADPFREDNLISYARDRLVSEQNKNKVKPAGRESKEPQKVTESTPLSETGSAGYASSGYASLDSFDPMSPLFRSKKKPVRRLSQANKKTPKKASSTRPHHWQLDHRQFEFGKKFANGGFGQVCRARFRGVNVATKCVFSNIIMKLDFKAVTRELKSLSLARHINVVQFMGYTYDSNTGAVAIVTELCAMNLRVWLRLQPGVPCEGCSRRGDTKELLVKAQEVAYGMWHLHEDCCLAHMDLKLENVLVNKHNVAKICDFGLSVAIGGSVQHLNDTHKQLGYVAPEALSRPEGMSRDKALKFGFRIDVYAYGLLLYNIFTEAKDPERSSRSSSGPFQRTDPPPIDLVPDTCPKAVKDLMQDCWIRLSSARPTFHSVAKTLETVQLDSSMTE